MIQRRKRRYLWQVALIGLLLIVPTIMKLTHWQPTYPALLTDPQLAIMVIPLAIFFTVVLVVPIPFVVSGLVYALMNAVLKDVAYPLFFAACLIPMLVWYVRSRTYDPYQTPPSSRFPVLRRSELEAEFLKIPFEKRRTMKMPQWS